MAVQTLKLAGEKFVILPEQEYRELREKAKGKPVNGAAKPPRTERPHKMTAQDWGDVAESQRRAADPNEKTIPWAEARKRLG